MAIKKNRKSIAQKVVKKEKPRVTVKTSRASMTMTSPKGEYVATVGRRRTSTARVRLYPRPGDFIINGVAAGKYFENIPNAATFYNQPFVVTNCLGRYAVTVKVTGGGKNGQLGALTHGLARALVKMNPDYHELFRETSLLTRDDRMKESRKIGTGGKARRKRQSPKR